MTNRFSHLIDTSWQSIKNGYNQSANGEFSKAFSQLGDIGQSLFNFLGFGSSIYGMSALIDNKNLKPRQKIIPLIGHALAGIFSLIIGIVACAAATVLIPPFMFAGSVANMIRNIGLYNHARSEKRNLQKIFNDRDKLDQTINPFDLPDKLREDFKTFIHLSHFSANKIQELYVRIGNHFINKTVEEQKALSELIQQSKNPSSSEKEKNKILKEIKIKEKILKDKFQEEYGPLFELLEKKQRLHFLKKSGSGVHFVNIGLSAGIAVLSLLAWVVPLAIAATPAAPFAPTVYSAISGLSTGVGCVAGIHATQTAIKEYRMMKKVQDPKSKISKAVFPKISKSEKKSLETKLDLTNPINEAHVEKEYNTKKADDLKPKERITPRFSLNSGLSIEKKSKKNMKSARSAGYPKPGRTS